MYLPHQFREGLGEAVRRLPDVAFFCVDVLSLWVFRAVSAFCRCAILCLFFVLFFDDSGRVPFSIGDLIAGYAPSFFSSSLCDNGTVFMCCRF